MNVIAIIIPNVLLFANDPMGISFWLKNAIDLFRKTCNYILNY